MASDVTTRLEATPADFKALFDRMAALGDFAVRRMSGGSFFANVKLPTPDGVTVEVASDFKHATVMSALVQLSARLDDLRARLSAGAVK